MRKFFFTKISRKIAPNTQNDKRKKMNVHVQTERIDYDDHILRKSYDISSLNETCNLPRSIFCPITRMPMQDPVILSDGNSYERNLIEKWINKKHVSPLTGEELHTIVLIPNHTLRTLISEIIQKEE